jgi:uncharacterized protein YdhG (YjbR/CyaY superfamily)
MQKTKQQTKTIDEYIELFPEKIKIILRKMKGIIKKAAPQATETISYQIPTFKLHGNLVYFAAFKDHISFFPTSSGVEKFKKELSGFVTSKGTIQFPLDKPIPYGLVRKITQYRVKENTKRIKK